MASAVYNVEKVTLQDGSEVTLKPLNIKRLREFMKVVEKFDDSDDETAGLEHLLDACALCLEKELPEVASSREKLEEALDVPTIWRILEICGGIKMDPNLAAAAVLNGRT